MAITRISASEFANNIATAVNDRDPSLDTRIGVIRDLFIDPFAYVSEQQNNRVVYLSNLTSLKYASKLVPDDLDDFIYNEGLVRWQGSRSVTVVTFSRYQPPTVDIVVPVNFPISTDIDQTTGQSVTFRTIETQTMFAAAASAYYNADTGKYELDVAVASVTTGVETSVAAYTISTMRRPLSGFDEVTNKNATTSGKGVETNQEAADRYLLSVKGTQLGSPTGCKKYIMDTFSNVLDAYVVYGENAYLTRQEDDAGAVDIWIYGEASLERTYVTTYTGVEILIPMDRQPVIRIVSVTDGITNFVEGTDFEVVLGEGEYSYSTRASDGIKFLTTGSVPAMNAPITIVFQYNSLMEILESWFTQSDFYSMGSDRLFRWAQAEEIEIEANLKVKSGDPDNIKSSVRTLVTDYINGLLLGDNVEEFDIDRVIAANFPRSVDNWTYTTLALLDGSGVADIEVAPTKYAYINPSNLIINLV